MSRMMMRKKLRIVEKTTMKTKMKMTMEITTDEIGDLVDPKPWTNT